MSRLVDSEGSQLCNNIDVGSILLKVDGAIDVISMCEIFNHAHFALM